MSAPIPMLKTPDNPDLNFQNKKTFKFYINDTNYNLNLS